MGKQGIKRSISRYERTYKEPLKGILDSVDNIEKSVQEDSGKLLYAQRIKNSTIKLERATKLMAEYLMLSNGQYPHKRRCIDLVRFVRGIVRVAAPYALRNGIAFDYKLPQYPMFTITETEPLTIILGHLLSNACRFHSPGDRVSVDMYRKDNNALIFVWDRGPGIPDPVIPHIFEPYYSYSPDGSPFAGNGLGLTIAKQLAEFIGGRLDYGPNIQGSYFLLTLPLYERKRPRPSKPPIPKETIKIIMADTEPVTKEFENNGSEMKVPWSVPTTPRRTV